MRYFKFSLVMSFILVPSFAFAWGPLTHIYLGSEILSLGALLPAGLYAMLKKYKHDYLYGNLIADIIIGKKYLSEDKNPHSWEMALTLLESAKTQQQKAFAYGYMSHLAADTIAHGTFMGDRKNIGHTLVEMRADSIIDKKYWQQAVRIDRKVQQRNDIFLARSVESAFFSFKTNKKIFRSVLLLSCFNQESVGELIQKNAIRSSIPDRVNIQQLHIESIDRIIDILCYGEDSEVLNESPMVLAR